MRSERKKLYFALAFLAVGVASVFLAFRPGTPPVAAADPKRSATSRQGAFQIMNEPTGGASASAGTRRRSAAGLTADPTLRLDLLAKVQGVKYEGGERNIFQFYTPPPRPVAPVVTGPEQTAGPVTPPPPPPPPPIPLKFYGFASAPGETPVKAFLSDPEEIYIVKEGELVKKRYKVIKIAPTNIEMEDTQTKSRQKLALQES
jgi:hypothetical protein